MEIKVISKSTEIIHVEKVLNNLLHSQEIGDIELFSSCFDHGNHTINIGTDIDEYWENWPDFFSYMKQMIHLRNDLKISSKNTKIHLSKNEKVAWYSQLIDTCIETKVDPFRLEGFRHTGVMIKVDNQWKIVQSHISVPLVEDIDESKEN